MQTSAAEPRKLLLIAFLKATSRLVNVRVPLQKRNATFVGKKKKKKNQFKFMVTTIVMVAPVPGQALLPLIIDLGAVDPVTHREVGTRNSGVQLCRRLMAVFLDEFDYFPG